MKKEKYLAPDSNCYELMCEGEIMAGSDDVIITTGDTTYTGNSTDPSTGDGDTDNLIITTP